MVNLTIDGRPAQVPEGTTILEAARQADIHIPHLCYLKGINEIAACRVCCVEVEGERAMVTACNNPVRRAWPSIPTPPGPQHPTHQRGAHSVPARLQVRHLCA